MRYLSAISTAAEPYRAGAEIGEGLRPISPEVVLLFAAISYERGLSDLFAGLSDSLENPNLIIFGGTGDGIYETTQAANYAASALGIASGGAMVWSTALCAGVKADSAGAAEACARRALEAIGGTADFCMVLADGSSADGTGIVRGVRSVVGIPVFGGLTGDDRKFVQSRVFLNGAEHDDAVAVLLGRGSMPYALNAASGWRPQGDAGRVEEAEGTEIRRVGGQSPRDFMTGQLGKRLGESDLGVVPLAAYREGAEGPSFLRTPNRIDEVTGSLTTFGSIPVGALVRICVASREEVLQGVARAVEGILAGGLGFEPKAALVVSCAGRKWLLSDRGDQELRVLFQALGGVLPLAGFPSFGEIGPFRQPDRSYSESYFHNVTFVLCLLGG